MSDEWVEIASRRFDRLSHRINVQSMKQLLKVYALEEDEGYRRELRNEMESILGAYEAPFLDYERPVLAPPPPGRLNGELVLGTVAVGDEEVGELKLPLNALCRGLGIYAQSGHAKSTVIRGIEERVLIPNGIPFIHLDRKKEGRYLLPKHPNVIVLPANKIPWNPFRNPPGMNIRSWGQVLSDILGHSWKIYVAGVNYIWQMSSALYDEYDKTGRMPTFKDLREQMLQTTESTRKGMEYWETIWNKVDTTVSVFGDLLAVREGLRLETLLSKQVILELDGLRADIANWMAECFLVFFFQYHLANDIRSEKLRFLIIGDEAQYLFYPMEYQDVYTEMGPPRLFDIPIMGRDMGLGLVTATQMPSMISKVVAANQLIKLAGNVSSGTEIWALQESLGLTDEVTEYIHRLKRAEWICRINDYYTEPMLLITPDLPINRNVTGDMVLERLRLLQLPDETPDKTAEPQQQTTPRITEDAKALLFDINNHPFRGVSKRFAAQPSS
jgi:hypothetical protein